MPGPAGTDAASSALAAQIDRLVALGFAERLGQSPARFRQALLALQQYLPSVPGGVDVDTGRADAVIVIQAPALPARDMLAAVAREGKAAVERLYPKRPEDFRPIEDVALPAGEAYLLLGVDRGNATLNAVPHDAQKLLAASGQSPLTLEEGIAVLLQWPALLQPNRCFMMLGSRCGDRRVPALWLSNGQPKLGWCWEGNPHSWLGFASCLHRSAGVALS